METKWTLVFRTLPEWQKLTVASLRGKCRHYDIPLGGKKKDIVERLFCYFNPGERASTERDTPSEPVILGDIPTEEPIVNVAGQNKADTTEVSDAEGPKKKSRGVFAKQIERHGTKAVRRASQSSRSQGISSHSQGNGVEQPIPAHPTQTEQTSPALRYSSMGAAANTMPDLRNELTSPTTPTLQ